MLRHPPQAFLSPVSPLVPRAPCQHSRGTTHVPRRPACVAPRRRSQMVANPDTLNLPPKLQTYVDQLAKVPDPKLRYQQLLFLARQLPPMDPALKTDANRVRGCTSVVHVHVSLDPAGAVALQGDSDAQLTKGLLALLVNGLTGVPARDVHSVDPAFITYSGLSMSLTPSRNNGFVNMLAKIKASVAEMEETRPVEEGQMEQVGDVPGRPVYSAILRKLAALKPTALDVTDDSAQHAGHAGAKGLDGESHFSVNVVADAFEGLGMVQRHRLVYTLLNEEMSSGNIHALSIDARTPEEAES